MAATYFFCNNYGKPPFLLPLLLKSYSAGLTDNLIVAFCCCLIFNTILR